MPKPPYDDDNFDKVNFVIDAWTTGCDAPWYVYVETMKPALLAAFITLITFGWDDVLRGALRPKGLHRRTAKRKGKWARRVPRFPEIGEMVGKQLPIAEQLDDYAKWNALAKTLWRVDTAMQAAMFFWLVAEVTEDFAFEWTSLLYESYWCQPDPPGRFSYRRSGMFAIPQYTWDKRGFGEEDYEEPPPEWFFNQGATGANPATITAALRLAQRPGFPMPSSLTTRIVRDSDNKVYAQSETSDTDSNGDADAIVFGTVPPRTAFNVQARMLGASWANVGDGVVIGIEIKD